MTEEEKLTVNGGPKIRTQSMPPRMLLGEEEKKAVTELFDEAVESGKTIGYNGPEEEAFCEEAAEYLGGGYVDAVNSGTSAVYVALKALEIEPFSEVIVPPISDPGGIMPVPLINCIPIVADSAPYSYNTGPEQIEKVISPLTKAIIVAHIAGEPADMEGIIEVSEKYDIPVIEDCAQAHGTRLNGEYVGKFGEIAAFSTMFGKHFSTGGQGGFAYTQDEELYWKIRRAADRGKPFGLPRGSSNCTASLNLNLNELQAAVGRVQLKKLPSIISRRQRIVKQLQEGLKSLKSVSIPSTIEGAEATYWFLRIQVNTDVVSCDKETLCRAVKAEGIPLNPLYDCRPQSYDWFKNKSAFGTGNYPWSSPEYKGNPDRNFPCPNIEETLSVQFNLSIHENWDEQAISDAVRAFKKVEKAYLA